MNQVDKHMFTIGKRGTAKGDFEYPRGLTVDEEGNIFVADTKNHRIQVFNQFGIYKKKFGEKGSGDGQLDCPTGVAVMPNEDVAVAELKNKRVQIFSSTFKFKSQFATVDEPIALVSDRQFTLIVATSRATVEVYRRLGKLQHKFALNVPKGVKKSSPCVVFIAVNNKDEVLVSDPASCSLTFYKYDGTPLYRFEPPAASEGLGFVPAGVDFDMLGNIVVADSLNHVVNVYSERGALLRHHAGPVDDMGAVQALVLGMDGHLVVIECTSNGPHCVKIFRYMDCECHKERPGSSLCQSPVPTDVE